MPRPTRPRSGARRSKSAGLELRPPRTAAELRALADLTFQSFAGFGAPPARTRRWMRVIGHNNLRLARLDGEIVGGLGLFYFGQYFGGRAVPTSGVTIVGVRPEFRAGGVGAAMIQEMLRQEHEAGVPLSLLYPSTWGFYRGAGYENAGHCIRYKIDVAGLRPRGGGDDAGALRVRPLRKRDELGVAKFYEALARHGDGNLCRARRQWHRILHLTTTSLYPYVIEERARPHRLRGYFSFEQSSSGFPYKIFIKDYRVADPQAMGALLRFLASHRSMAETIEVEGGATDPLNLASEATISEIGHTSVWMLRILDVARALTARGYARQVAGVVQLELRDDRMKHNEGRWTLRVRDGRALVAPGGRGEVKLDIRGLASLYSGFRSAHALVPVGLASGPVASLDALSAMFAGPAPWMNDRF